MKNISLIVLDVDGTLTDGAVYYGDNNLELKAFNTRDGAILKPLRLLGIDVIFLTGRESEAVKRRASDLGAVAVQGVDDKFTALRELLAQRGISPDRCAYVGDDLNDYAAMSICGFKACPADAVSEIRGICDYVSPYNGGHGAVRDVCEHILRCEGKYAEFLGLYGVGICSC